MIKQFTFNHFETNCYVVIDEASKECLIIDPCMEGSYEDSALFQYITEQKLTPKKLALTHAHVDHLAGLKKTANRYGLPVTMQACGKKLLAQADAYGAVMGFNVESPEDIEIDPILEGSQMQIGETIVKCLDVSGHCIGSTAYLIESERKVITGDALFCGSIGRTDLPGGDFDLLQKNIREKLLILDDDYAVLPGHGDCSTIGDERHNPFLFD